MRSLYRLAVSVAAPLHAATLALRGRTAPGRRVTERFGFGARIEGAPLWIHAASVGEVQLAATVVRALRERCPALPILITAFTATGAARAGGLGLDLSVRYLPYDLPGPVRRFLDRARPRLAIILETELWPTLYRACHQRDVGLVVANARLSRRSARRYRRFGTLFRAALSGAHVAAQSAEDAERFRAIGAEPDRTRVIGNLKFDITLPPDIAVRGGCVRERYAPDRPMWVAGSTHEGEDERVIAAHGRIRERLPGALLVLAPRHPQRFDAVAARLAERNIPYVRHSRAADHQRAGDARVVLLDTLGELLDFYAAADVAFVGGSLVPVGGHNLLEPAALGRPVATGPFVFNAAQVADILIECGGARVVSDTESLAACIGAWLQDAPERARVGGLGRAAVEANRGALERLMALIEPLLADAARERHDMPEA